MLRRRKRALHWPAVRGAHLGLLHHVGFTSTLAGQEKLALTKRLEKLVAPPGFTADAPGGPIRWSTERSAAWQPPKPKLVVEVEYDRLTGNRFRHGTRLLRWRPDKAPGNAPSISCPADLVQSSASASRTNSTPSTAASLADRHHRRARILLRGRLGTVEGHGHIKTCAGDSLSFRPCGPLRSGRPAACCLFLCRFLAASPRYLSLTPISVGFA
jgi:hypothetical protein